MSIFRALALAILFPGRFRGGSAGGASESGRGNARCDFKIRRGGLRTRA